MRRKSRKKNLILLSIESAQNWGNGRSSTNTNTFTDACFPSPLQSKLNTPDKGDIKAKFDDVDNQTFLFDRTNQTRIFRRIMYVHAGWKLYYKT